MRLRLPELLAGPVKKGSHPAIRDHPASIGRVPRRVFRPHLQRLPLLGLALAMIVLGVAAGTGSNSGYVIVAVAGAVLLVRAWRLGVAVETGGLAVRYLGRDRFIAWERVDDVAFDMTGMRFGVLPVFGVLVTLKPDTDEPGGSGVAGDVIGMAALASYRRSVAERRAATLQAAFATAALGGLLAAA